MAANLFEIININRYPSSVPCLSLSLSPSRCRLIRPPANSYNIQTTAISANWFYLHSFHHAKCCGLLFNQRIPHCLVDISILYSFAQRGSAALVNCCLASNKVIRWLLRQITRTPIEICVGRSPFRAGDVTDSQLARNTRQVVNGLMKPLNGRWFETKLQSNG